MVKEYGKCHLCGKECQLTFEHLPPQKVDNNKKVNAILGETLINHIG